MSAWLELHTVLSLRLDAREAYRLANNYQAEVLRNEASNLRRVEREGVPERAIGTKTGLLKAALILDERADLVGQGPSAVAADDAEAYPGELEMLCGLVRTLRVVVRPDDTDVDVAEVRRLLHHHASDDAAARAQAKPSFFQPDHTYRRSSHGQFLHFRVDYEGIAPNGTERTAFGWLQTERGGTPWTPWNEDDFTDWTDVTEAGETR